MEEYDVIVIGSGQGGIPFAFAMADRGRHVALFERERVGGSCVNWGCTPAKAFLAAAHSVGRARRAAELGVHCDITIDFPEIMARVGEIRDRSNQGLVSSLYASDIEFIRAEAGFAADGSVRADGQAYRAPLVVIDTGSRAALPPIEGLAEVPYMTDRNFWDMDTLPPSCAVIGGGYVGLELGQGLARLGSEVHIFESGPRILATEADDVAATLAEALQQDGVKLHTGIDIERVEHDGEAFQLTTPQASWSTAGLLVATGREPNTRALNLSAAGIRTDERGSIRVNEQLETTQEGVYAIGEAAGQPAFTHVSWEDHRRLLDHIEGRPRTRHDRVLGYAVFTEPQVGRAGLSLDQARARDIPVMAASMAVKDMARGKQWGEALGFYRLVAERDSGRLLGAELVGYEASELIHVFIDLIEKHTTLEELGSWQHIHPTFAENLPSLARMAESV